MKKTSITNLNKRMDEKVDKLIDQSKSMISEKNNHIINNTNNVPK